MNSPSAEAVDILRYEVGSLEYHIIRGAAVFVSVVNEHHNYYSNPRNVCCEKKSDARLNEEMLIFVLQELP